MRARVWGCRGSLAAPGPRTVRYGGDIPIYADEAVLDEAGVLFDADEEEQEVEQFREFLDSVTPEDFA